jgi:hypothetical protein
MEKPYKKDRGPLFRYRAQKKAVGALKQYCSLKPEGICVELKSFYYAAGFKTFAV